MKKIIHIIYDDKFFDNQLPIFDSLESFESKFVLYLNDKNKKIKYIKNIDRVAFVFSYADLLNIVSDADIVYFHSFSSSCYELVSKIPKNKIVIAWFWGYDIYNTEVFDGVIDIELYKPFTKNYFKCSGKTKLRRLLRKFVYRVLLKKHYLKIRNKAFSRIDYCMPVLRYEYDLIKKNSFFKAKYFTLPRLKCQPENRELLERSNNILFGNSATPTNNHLDVFEVLKNVNKVEDRNIIIPLNYGDNRYRSYLKEQISNYSFHKLQLLENFLPFDDYNQLINSCSYAIFGHLRQQAIYNVNYCLSHGIKVFLYKDSIAYHQFKNIDGYIIYSIDDDLNSDELSAPLTQEQIIHNLEVYNRSKFNSIEEINCELNQLFNSFIKHS